MNRLKLIPALLGALVVTVVTVAQENPLIIGPNINMVSGQTWPDGDPFLRQQNEGTVAFSSRNKLHLLVISSISMACLGPAGCSCRSTPASRRRRSPSG